MQALILILSAGAFPCVPDDEPADPLPVAMRLDEPAKRAARRQQEEPQERPSRLDRSPVPEGDAAGWSVSAAVELKFLSGRTRVREWDSQPEWLDLGGDLGFGEAPGLRLVLARDTRYVRTFLELELLNATGKGTLDHDFDYDEDHFLAGIPFETHATMFFARGGLAFKRAFVDRESVSLGFLIGLEYPRMDLGIDQGAVGTSEQYEQFIPYPILGLVGEARLAPSLTLSGRAYVGYMPRVPTPYVEGGRLHMTAQTFSLEATLTWQASSAVCFTLGLGYSAWSGSLRSAEDGNELNFGGPQVTLGIEIRW